METDPRIGHAQSAARVHPVRKRGNLQLNKDELARATRDHAQQCASGQLPEFTGCKKPEEALFCRPGQARPLSRERSKSRGRYGRPQEAAGRRYSARGHSLRRTPRCRKRSHPKRETREEESENKNEEKILGEYVVRRETGWVSGANPATKQARQ